MKKTIIIVKIAAVGPADIIRDMVKDAVEDYFEVVYGRESGPGEIEVTEHPEGA